MKSVFDDVALFLVSERRTNLLYPCPVEPQGRFLDLGLTELVPVLAGKIEAFRVLEMPVDAALEGYLAVPQRRAGQELRCR